jgi:hypothetical protein
VVDVWESQGDFDRFAPTLLPILEKNGIVLGGPPRTATTHNIVRA